MNAKFDATKKTLTLVLPVEDGSLSKSGKTLVRFTTSGFAAIPGTNMRIGVNLISPLPTGGVQS